MGHSGPENGTSQLWISSENFFKILENEKLGQCDLFSLWTIFCCWLAMVNLSQLTVNQIFKQSGHDFFHDYYWILKQDMIRILEQWRYDFSGKHLCDVYCRDIMGCLCGGQKSWFCKASLRICYVILSECKGPWMLKTHKLPCVEQKIARLDWKSTMYSVVKLSSYFFV